MSNSEVFDRLVKELDPLERKELIDKLSPDSVVEAEAMIREEPEEEFDLEKEYYSLGLLNRIIIFFKVNFRNADKFQLTEDIVLKRIEREVRRNAGDILSYGKGRLGSDFLEEVSNLSDSVLFFASTVNTACGEGREEFLNFLGSLKIPIIHHQLILDTNFKKAEERTGFGNPVDVRKDVMMCVETNLAKITGDLRKSMYIQSKTIFIMGELVNFDFNGFQGMFKKMDGEDGKSCYFGDARSKLERLTEILSSFRVSPEKQLLEAMYLFHNSTFKVKDQEALSGELKAYLESASRHIKMIIKFNQKMQLVKVMRLVSGNINYKPRPLSGGEDWFNLYARYWNNLAESKYKIYSAEKRKQKIYQDMQMYFKKDKMPEMEFYRHTFKFSCGFMSLFLREQFTAGMNDVLKKILVDGKFYKKSNKEHFTDAYSALLGLYEKMKNFDKKNSAKGEFGMKIDTVNSEASTDSAKSKKIAAIHEASDFEAREIIRIGVEGLYQMKNVLYGILHGKAGGQYDSLSNLNKLITIESRDFIIDLNTVYENITDAYRILGDILSLEEAE